MYVSAHTWDGQRATGGQKKPGFRWQPGLCACADTHTHAWALQLSEVNRPHFSYASPAHLLGVPAPAPAPGFRCSPGVLKLLFMLIFDIYYELLCLNTELLGRGGGVLLLFLAFFKALNKLWVDIFKRLRKMIVQKKSASPGAVPHLLGHSFPVVVFTLSPWHRHILPSDFLFPFPLNHKPSFTMVRAHIFIISLTPILS